MHTVTMPSQNGALQKRPLRSPTHPLRNSLQHNQPHIPVLGSNVTHHPLLMLILPFPTPLPDLLPVPALDCQAP